MQQPELTDRPTALRIARFAKDADDLRDLLEMLGVLVEPPEKTEEPKPVLNYEAMTPKQQAWARLKADPERYTRYKDRKNRQKARKNKPE